jgi:glutathione synthase
VRIGVLVNDVARERSSYTTVALLRAARRHAHRVFVIGVGDFVYEAGRIAAWAREAPDAGESPEAFVEALRASPPVRSTVGDLDVLLLRNNPYDDLEERPWAAQAGLVFGEEAKRCGVLVLNDPAGLAHALNKLYLERFPAALRPASIVTRHAEDVRVFAAAHGTIVVKPLNGSGGRGVFIVRPEDDANFNQILEAVGAHGYVVAQEYVPEAREGDVRLLLLNGRPLEKDGKIAAMGRVSAKGDLRHNVSAGASVKPVNVSACMLELAELARPRLIEDGMFLVGLDIVGSDTRAKVLEVNVFSPGGLVSASAFSGVDYAAVLVEDLERKVAHASHDHFDNRLLACL